MQSRNLVARLNLPNMAYVPQEKLEVYAWAVRGLIELKPRHEKWLKYAELIDIYADLDDNERNLYSQRYQRKTSEMTGFAQRFIEQGIQKGLEQGLQAERHLLSSLVRKRFGAETAEHSAPSLVRITDPRVLEALAEVMLNSEDVGAWLTAVSRAAA
jgi:flagellar biosynthesis/type III secretory pathway protein FliH